MRAIVEDEHAAWTYHLVIEQGEQHTVEQRKKLPVRLEDVEEFEFVKRIPRAAISDEIRAGVRNLDEEEEVERFLREILPDHTKTPHTSTEIADILTTHVTYAGQPRLAAFINKGKAYPKVTAKEVTHQIVRVQQLHHLSLIVLLAVGYIQDDAKRDLLYTATNTQADYMIVDTDDVARLFIAAHKICPKDGTPYEGGRCRKCGVAASEPIKVTLNIFEEPRYDILSPQDTSIGTAKRYTATILTDPHYSKETVKEVIKAATMELRQSTFYGTKQAQERFGKQEAGCVFLFVYIDRRDLQTANWICRTSWIRSDVPKMFRPPTTGDDWLGEIQIDWRTDYDEMRTFWSGHFESKEVWTRQIELFLPTIEKMVQEVEDLLKQYESRKVGRDQVHRTLEQLEPTATSLYQKVGEQGFAPPECEQCETVFGSMIGSFHMIFLPFMTGGKANWDWEQKLWIVKDGLRRYAEEHREFLYEWKKIGKWP